MKPVAMLAAALLAAPALAAESGAPAVDNAPRIWRAISGDTLELDGKTYRLRGVDCPEPETSVGRQAKALLNTFLRGGYISCEVSGKTASCRKEGRDMASGMVESGLCEARDEVERDAASEELVLDARPGMMLAEEAQARCLPAARERFIAGAQAAACDAGSPASLCRGRSGLRQFGRYVAPSDAFRASGATAPAFNPFRCR